MQCAGSVLPELVDSGEDGDGSVPDVACVVHLPALHLHLGVFEPQSDVPVVHVQRSLVNGARPETTRLPSLLLLSLLLV